MENEKWKMENDQQVFQSICYPVFLNPAAIPLIVAASA
jgi:hypothetical protein